MQIGVHKVAMAAPNDVSELAKLIDSGAVKAAEIVALIGKTEGNGGANDFTRGFATSSYQTLLAKHLGISPEEVGKRDRFRLVRRHGRRALAARDACSPARPRRARPAARASRWRSRSRATSLPEEVGTMAQVREVAEATRRCLAADRHHGPEGRALRAGEGPAADAGEHRGRRPARQDAAHARSEWLEALRPRRDRARRRARAWRGRREGRERRRDRESASISTPPSPRPRRAAS